MITKRFNPIAILIGFVFLTWVGGFLAFYQFKTYLDAQAKREEEAGKLIALQQKILEDTQSKLEILRQESEKQIGQIRADANKQIAQIQQQTSSLITQQQSVINELRLPVKYVQSETNFVNTDSTQVIRPVAAGTRVSVVSQSGEWSTVKIGTQRGRILTQFLDDDPPTIPDITAVVRQWRPNMAFIICEFKHSDGKVYLRKSGSGTVFALEDGPTVITNKHVISDDNGTAPSSCNLKFPTSSHVFNEPTGRISFSPKYDWGAIKVPEFGSHISLASISRLVRCNTVSDGDEIVVVGYPGIGSQNDITSTRGIVSGRDGDYYITDAKIDFGNSGGASILIRQNCYLGVPTFAIAGGVEALGRILDAYIVFPR